MTQEVQPLTWQKRTNIEEHQQFFAKINEIVGQLSGTVERSETALTEVTVALAQASTAVAAAINASNQAQTAATTVAGYNTRLTAVEVQAATNKSDISQLDVETQDLYDRDAQSVKLAADHIQVITGGLDLRGTNRSPNTSVGADDTVIANGHRIVQELNAYDSAVDGKLNAYDQMVRTSGNQTISGLKTFSKQIYGMCYFPLVFKAFRGSSTWWKVCKLRPQRAYLIEITKSFPYNNGSRYYAKALINISKDDVRTSCHVLNIISKGPSGNIGDIIVGQTANVTTESTTYSYELYVKQTSNANLRVNCLEVMSTTINYGPEDITIIDEESQDPQTIEGLNCIIEAID